MPIAMKNDNHPLSSLGDIRTVFFDLDGTLRHKRPTPSDAMLDFAVRTGVADSPEKRRQIAYWEHYYWGRSEELLNDIAAYSGINDAFWEKYVIRHLQAYGCDDGCIEPLAPEIAHFMQEVYDPEIYVEPDAPETLQKLKAANFRMGLLSNRRDPCDEVVAELGLMGYFELILVAGEVGAWKPETPLFEHALARLGIAPHEAVYIGDNYFTDILGARAAGLQPILYDPRGVFPDADCPVIAKLGELQLLIA